MPMTRRSFVKLTAAAPFAATAGTVRPAHTTADDSRGADVHASADLLGLPAFVTGVARDEKLSFSQPPRFADLEARTPIRHDHIDYLASITKTFTPVMIIQHVHANN